MDGTRPRLDERGARLSEDALFTEGRWQLHASGAKTWANSQGWQTVIAHMCPNAKGTPFWMLIEHHRDPTVCVYCKVEMPDSIVTLFKLQNMDAMRGG